MHSSKLKENVKIFNQDAETNEGFIYNTNSKFSSVVASKRITDAINGLITINIDSIIDLGCGDGIYTNEIKKQFPHVLITGIEPAANAIKIAQLKYNNINFVVSNVYDAEYLGDKHYDLSIFRGVIHHTSDPELAIKNASLISDKMILLEPNGNNFILKLIEKHSKYHIEHEEQSFSTNQLVEWCDNSGWEVKSLTYIGFVPIFFPTILSKIIYFFQPMLEKIPILNKYLSGQVLILCDKK